MPTRRQFLGSLAAIALTPHEALACPPVTRQPSVNDRLEDMAARLREYPQVAEVLTYPAEGANKALVHWGWSHMHDRVDAKYLPSVEKSQAELMAAIATGIEDPRLKISELLTEGMVVGKEQEYLDRHLEAVRTHLHEAMETRDSFTGLSTEPLPSEINANLKRTSLLQKTVTHTFSIYDPSGVFYERRSHKISANAMCGAPYMLHHLHGLPLIATEDPEIDKKAEKAQWDSTPEEYQRWIHTERNKHFVEVAKGRESPISHFVCGYGHDLREEAKKQQVSLAVVHTKAVAEGT